MYYAAVATDFDGTLAHDGKVPEEALAALRALRASGRQCLLVTGRQLHHLVDIFPEVRLFDLVVAENGVVLHSPGEGWTRSLAGSPPEHLVEELRRRGAGSIDVGQGIVALWRPHEETALAVIRDLGLEFQVVFNKGAVMLVPSGHNKATGLRVALAELGLSTRNTVGIGDAENDHAFLRSCEYRVAVGNAVPAIRALADQITWGNNGHGFAEFARQLIAEEPAPPARAEVGLLLGTVGEHALRVSSAGSVILVAGPSRSGKSSYVAHLLESLVAEEYQCCIIDPEGDHDVNGTAIGSAFSEPPAELVLDILREPYATVTLDLLGVEPNERQGYFRRLMGMLRELRAMTGRPHWIVLDEAHHMLYPPVEFPELLEGTDGTGLILVTVEPSHLDASALQTVTHVIALDAAPRTIEGFCDALHLPPPTVPGIGPVVWRVGTSDAEALDVGTFRRLRARHARKYAEADLGADRSFYFRGPREAMNLPARNVAAFIDLAEGLDEATWMFHLRRGDYGRWFRVCLRDEELAAIADRVAQAGQSAAASKAVIRSEIIRRYAPPA